MSSLDFDFDTQMAQLELEWRKVYEAGVITQTEYQALSADSTRNRKLLDMACQRMNRAEAMKGRIMAKIERLEDSMLGQHCGDRQ